MTTRRSTNRSFLREALQDPHSTLRHLGLSIEDFPNQGRLWEYDVDSCVRELAKKAAVDASRVKTWECPCCDGVKAIYIVGAPEGVWFSLCVAIEKPTGTRIIARFDNPEEIDQAPDEWPDVPDRTLIAAYWESGLKELLLGGFAS